MQILSIGNSFSQDATAYLHDLAKRSGKIITTANLFIGGCPIEKHFRNFYSDRADYELQFNGDMTGFRFSIREVLLSRSWDVITIQQASHFSGYYNTYTPYLERLVEEIRSLCPQAKVLLHKTWAYEEGCPRLPNAAHFETAEAMYNALTDAYNKAFTACGFDGMIPSGDVMFRLSKAGIGLVHRDTFHASFGVGRYALAMTWFRYLTGVDVSDNDFTETTEPMTEEQIATVKRLVNEITPMVW